MTSSDLTEMEWLAATLHATAERLQRATALLRAAGDLERLQARVQACCAPPGAPRAGEPVQPAGAAVVRAPAGCERRAVDSPATRVGASRIDAVFDPETDGRKLVGKKFAGGSRPPF